MTISKVSIEVLIDAFELILSTLEDLLKIQYDCRLSSLSWVEISPCYAKSNHVIGCLRFSHAYELNSYLECQLFIELPERVLFTVFN